MCIAFNRIVFPTGVQSSNVILRLSHKCFNVNDRRTLASPKISFLAYFILARHL